VKQLAAAAALGLWLPGTALAQDGVAADELAWGRRIYEEGRLPSGTELVGTRAGSRAVSGAAVACVSCHRRSGMGQVEGNIQVPPITGNYLYAARSDKRLATMDPHVSKLFNQAHDPYTEASLAAAIRHGTHVSGREMNVLMPRYELADGDLRALTAYLNQLSAQWSPGASATQIRFATVITPDVEPARRQVFIDMLRTAFRQKNSSTKTASSNKTRHHMTSAAELILGTERRWELDIWELQGAPDTWREQLAERYRRQPVFALLSGLTGSTWQPVHDFCAAAQVPGWFPSVDLPGQPTSPYAFYFSAGVGLEAGIVARHLQDQKSPPRQLVQIHRGDAVGGAGAQALRHALAGSSIAVAERVLAPGLPAAQALAQVLRTLGRDDAAMFWLRPDDVAALSSVAPPEGQHFFSGLLGQGEKAPLPPAWRPGTDIVYPYELPQRRANNLDYFHVWLNTHKIALIDEAMQSEVFFALNFMTDTLAEMLDNMYRDYLLDRAEAMLGIREGAKSAQETRDRVALGRAGDLLKKHGATTIEERARVKLGAGGGHSDISEGTTMYPHLSLGAGQRLASKVGYIVRLSEVQGLIAQSELIVP
jgi:cytochrome c553